MSSQDRLVIFTDGDWAVGSIPIARPINPDDSIAFTRTSCWKPALKWPVMDRGWPEAVPIGPNICPFALSGWLLQLRALREVAVELSPSSAREQLTRVSPG